MITNFSIYESLVDIQYEFLVALNKAVHDEYPEGELEYDESKIKENCKKLDDIIERGADVNYYYVGDYTLDGVTKRLKETMIIYVASQSNSLTYIDYLTSKGADWNDKNAFGFDFLELYVRLGRREIFDEIRKKYPEKFREYVWKKIEEVENFSDLDFGPSRNGFGVTTKENTKGAVDTIEYVNKYCPDLLDRIKKEYPEKWERYLMDKEVKKFNL